MSRLNTLHQSVKIAKKPEKGRIDGQNFDFVKAGESAGSALEVNFKVNFFYQIFDFYIKNLTMKSKIFDFENFKISEISKIFKNLKIFNLGAAGTFFEISKKREKIRNFRFFVKKNRKSPPSSEKCLFKSVKHRLDTA